MSWLFSQALVAEYSAATSWDGAPSAPLSVMPTQHKFWRNDKTMEPSQLSRFGLTCAVLTADRGEGLLTWFRADSRVRTYPLLVAAPDYQASGPACGKRCGASLARYDRATSSWRTAQLSLLEDSGEFSQTWPNWGSMRAGECWELTTSAHRTGESASGLWPTPTVAGNYNAAGSSPKAGDGLGTAVAKRSMWPTATAGKGWSPGHARANSDGRLDYTVERQNFQLGQQTPPKRLNPGWVEWLMGWPTGWTALKPLEMVRFQEWQRQHSPRSDVRSNAA